MYATGLAVCSLATASSPSSTSYMQILMWRCLFSVGGGCAATMMTPILADYCHEEDKGRGAGLLGAAAGTGAVVSALVLLRVPDIARQWSGDTLPPDKAVACGYYTAATLAAGADGYLPVFPACGVEWYLPLRPVLAGITFRRSWLRSGCLRPCSRSRMSL